MDPKPYPANNIPKTRGSAQNSFSTPPRVRCRSKNTTMLLPGLLTATHCGLSIPQRRPHRYAHGCGLRHWRCSLIMSSGADALTVLSLPGEPSPHLSPLDIVHALCRGLQHVHLPSEHDGLRRVYAFASYECRMALTTRKGAVSGVERFVETAELHTLPGCLNFALGAATVIDGTQTRGAIATVPVDVSDAVPFRGPSGFELSPPPGEQQGDVRTERYRFQLQQERRPPLEGCWMVTSILPMREHMLYNGDTGAVQG